MGVNYTNTSAYDEQPNVLMMTSECDNPEVLSEMNLQLAYALAEHKEFLDKTFSVFIGGVDNVSTLKGELKWL